MSDFKKYPILNKILTEAAIPPPKDGWVFARLKKYKVVGGRQIYKGSRFGLLYAWDGTHGHWEVYSRKGKPLYERLNGDSNKKEDARMIPYGKKENRRSLNV